MWCCVIGWAVSDVSRNCSAFIFRAKRKIFWSGLVTKCCISENLKFSNNIVRKSDLLYVICYYNTVETKCFYRRCFRLEMIYYDKEWNVKLYWLAVPFRSWYMSHCASFPLCLITVIINTVSHATVSIYVHTIPSVLFVPVYYKFRLGQAFTRYMYKC
jgi:hypothetical protein